MTAFRARVLLGAFSLIFGGVAVNAMLLQHDGAPWSNTALLSETSKINKAVSKPQRRRVRRVLPRWNPNISPTSEDSSKTVAQNVTALPKPVPATTISVTPTTKAAQATVRAIQRELTARGYEPGPVDGILGVMTRAAIMAYEHDERLTLTANPTEGLLERIILGGVGEGSSSPRGPAQQHARLLAESVQDALTRLGYVPGPADGIVSTNTIRAIKAFEKDHNLATTGRISGRLVAEIGRVSGARFRIAAGW